MFTKEKTPYKWAKIKEQMGSLLFELSTKDNYTKEHKKALVSYKQSLTVFTEENYSDEWLNLHSSSGFKFSEFHS